MILSLPGFGAEPRVRGFALAISSILQSQGFQSRREIDVVESGLPVPNVIIWIWKSGFQQMEAIRLFENQEPWIHFTADALASRAIARYMSEPFSMVRPDGTIPATSTATIPASFSFVNETTGNRSLLRLGDHWTLSVTGAPNSDVVIVGGPGGRLDRNTMGRTNAAGVWTAAGSPGIAELGNWSQQIFVGGRSAGTLLFQVVSTPAPATPPLAPPPADQTVPEKLAEQAKKLGVPASWTDWATENPWLVAGAAAAVLFFLGRRK